jgi:hypothetical protein
MRMENMKSRQIGVSIGVLLILFSLTGPWISYSAKWSYINGTDKYNGRTYADASPFTITYTLNITSSTSLKPGPIRETIPVRLFLGEGTNYLYDPIATIIGIASIIGASISMISQYKERWFISFLGGLLIILSTLSIFITLPANINVLDSTVMLYWYVASIGAVLIIISSAFDVIKSFTLAFFDFFSIK